MAIRTSDREVRAVIETDSTISTSPFIEAANALADYVESQDSDDVLTTALLIKIETYLAAHLYALRDQQYEAKKTGDASATFQGKTAMRLDATSWGQTAMMLDVTGTLAGLHRTKNKASLAWLGFPPSEQTDYEDRD